MGPDDGKQDSGRFRIARRGPRPQLTHDEAMRHARQAGILGAIGSSRPQAFSSLVGTGDFTSGLDDRDVYGGFGDQDGEMRGTWGYAPEGTGPGGGGTGWDTIGVGRYATIGHEWGTGRDGGWRAGVMRRPAHDPRGPTTVQIGPAEVPGDYRPIVRRYIRQVLPRIQHCYERELLIRHDLAGTVTVRFVIGPDGVVMSSRGGGMGNANVEQCVAGVVKAIAFPRPSGGMMLNITYPFIFRPAGS
jgi:hypothetical protein